MPVPIEWLRTVCLGFPGATEQVQWGNDLVFKVESKMFAVTSLEPSRVWLSFKVTPEQFAELLEQPGIIPAPYLARAKWVAFQHECTMGRNELKALLRGSYDLVVAGLPKKAQAKLREVS
ncbi:MAG: MmcQ/YjbR family DNA-binding protein [Acidobacteriota bacterium]